MIWFPINGIVLALPPDNGAGPPLEAFIKAQSWYVQRQTIHYIQHIQGGEWWDTVNAEVVIESSDFLSAISNAIVVSDVLVGTYRVHKWTEVSDRPEHWSFEGTRIEELEFLTRAVLDNAPEPGKYELAGQWGSSESSIEEDIEELLAEVRPEWFPRRLGSTRFGAFDLLGMIIAEAIAGGTVLVIEHAGKAAWRWLRREEPSSISEEEAAHIAKYWIAIRFNTYTAALQVEAFTFEGETVELHLKDVVTRAEYDITLKGDGVGTSIVRLKHELPGPGNTRRAQRGIR